jgi:hypothetical protein
MTSRDVFDRPAIDRNELLDEMIELVLGYMFTRVDTARTNDD